MKPGAAQKRILLYVILPAAIIYYGLRFYAEFRHVNVYVRREAPMPAELAAGLHMEEHKISSRVRIESLYDAASDKIVPPEEIRRLRRAIARSGSMPAFIDSLIILTPTNAVARRMTRSSVREYQLVKPDGHWRVEGVSYQQVQRYAPEEK